MRPKYYLFKLSDKHLSTIGHALDILLSDYESDLCDPERRKTLAREVRQVERALNRYRKAKK